MRIAKKIARLGIASRREAERMIYDGRVKINDILITTPATFVQDTDIISIDNNILEQNFDIIPEIWRFYKPRKVIVSRHDPQGRTTIYSFLPVNMQKFIYIGRLDYNSEGLLLLTNSGMLARYHELPQNNIRRIYKCRINGNINPMQIQAAANGLTIDNISYKPIIITQISNKNSLNQWINVTLFEGKNREIRKVMAYFNLKVSRLIRLEYDKFNCFDLLPGEYKKSKI